MFLLLQNKKKKSEQKSNMKLRKKNKNKNNSRVLCITKTDIIILWCSCNSSTTLIPVNKLQCTKQHFFFVIKTTQHSQASVQLHIYKSYRAKACQCRHLGSQGTLLFNEHNTCVFCIKYSLK